MADRLIDLMRQRTAARAAQQPNRALQGRDQYGSTIQAQDPDLAASFYTMLGTLFPPEGITPARPTLPLPGTDRSLDLMGGLSMAADWLAPEAKAAALLAPGWVRLPKTNLPGALDEWVKYVAKTDDPEGRVFDMHAYFSPSGPGPNTWTLESVYPSNPDVARLNVAAPRGSSKRPTSDTLGPAGVAKLIQTFKADHPQVEWLTMARVGGLQGSPQSELAQRLKKPLAVDLRGRPRMVYEEDRYAKPGDPRYYRYNAFMEAQRWGHQIPPLPGAGQVEATTAQEANEAVVNSLATAASPPTLEPVATPAERTRATDMIRQIRERLRDRQGGR